MWFFHNEPQDRKCYRRSKHEELVCAGVGVTIISEERFLPSISVCFKPISSAYLPRSPDPGLHNARLVGVKLNGLELIWDWFWQNQFPCEY